MAFAPGDWLAFVLFWMWGFLPAFLSSGQSTRMNMYDSLERPIDIPRIVFPIVWTSLYTFYWLAGFLAWQVAFRSDDLSYTLGLACYLAGHLFNMVWTWLFFIRGWIAVAALDIIFMVALYTVACVNFFILRTWAGILMLPIIVWCVFALFLTILYWSRYGAIIKTGKKHRK